MKAYILDRWVLLGGAGLLGIAAGGHAQAQPEATKEASSAITEVVVTASRREMAIQDVPSAVTAISQAQIEARGIDSFEGFARSAPGITMNQTTKNRAVFNIRGIATNVSGGNTQDPVAVYINDTPVTDTYGAIVQPDLRLFDVERIEVLRGPQGTLFGSGSLGGTIRIITNKPDAARFEAAGRLDLGVTDGNALRQRYDAMVNVPLVEDVLALRVVGYIRDEEGWVKNVTLGVRNDTLDKGGRVAMRWTPSDALSVKGEIFHQQSDPKEGDNWDPSVGKFLKASPIAERRPSDITNYNLAIDYDIDNFARLTSSTSYQESNTAQLSNIGPLLGPGTPDFLGIADPWDSRFFVQELRLVSNTNAPLEWVAGAFYIDRKTHVPSFLITAPGLDAFFGGVLGSDDYFFSALTTKSTELAGYVDGTWEIFEGFKLLGGFRAFKTTSSYGETDRATVNFETLAYDVTPAFKNRSKDTNSTWRAGLSYEPTRDLLFYGSVSKGFRIGQVNSSRGPSSIDPSDYVIPEGYRPDTTLNYELGAKTSWLHDRLTVNIAGFYTDWKNIQIDAQRRSDFLFFIANAGKATVKGVELELTAQPLSGLSLYGSVTAQKGEIKSVPDNIVVPAAVGDTLPGLAEWKWAGGAEYRWDIRGGNQVFMRIDGQHTDAVPNAFANGGLNPLYRINEEYSTVDGSIGIETRWGNVSLYGENLANNDAYIQNQPSLLSPITTLRPRTVGVRVSYRL